MKELVNSKIMQPFESQTIHAKCNDETEEGCFSVTDVVAVLTDRPTQSSILKNAFT